MTTLDSLPNFLACPLGLRSARPAFDKNIRSALQKKETGQLVCLYTKPSASTSKDRQTTSITQSCTHNSETSVRRVYKSMQFPSLNAQLTATDADYHGATTTRLHLTETLLTAATLSKKDLLVAVCGGVGWAAVGHDRRRQSHGGKRRGSERRTWRLRMPSSVR